MGEKMGGNISHHTKYFPNAENLELLFFSTAFVDKIIRGNIVYNLFYLLFVNMGKCLPQKGKVCENKQVP